MTQQTLHVFETSLQKTHQWLKDVEQAIGLKTKEEAYIVLKAVLHAIRDRLPLEPALKFGMQLPLIIKGIYFDGWTPQNTPIRIHQPEEFLLLVKGYITNDRLYFLTFENVARVIEVISSHISPDEIAKIVKIFPEKVRAALFAELC